MGRILSGAAAGLLLAGLAAPAAAESLADAMVLAVRKSSELKVNRANIKSLAERAVRARAGGRIQVEANASLTARFFSLDDYRFPSTVSLDVVQPLYTGGRVENATEAAEIRISAEKKRKLETEQIIILRTVTAFMDVRRDLTLVRLGRNNVRVIREQLKAAQERFDVGEVTRTDVAQARARLAAARSQLAARTGRLQVSRENYKRVVGQYPGKLAPPPPLPDLPKSLKGAIAIAMTDDPVIQAARLERGAAGKDVKAAIGELLPQIALLGQARHSDTFRLRGDATSDLSLGIQVTVPIYGGGGRYARVRQAQAAVEAREGDIATAMRDAAQAVGNAWSDLSVAAATIRASRLQVRASRIAFEGVREEAKVGSRTTLDVLNAEQELFNARGTLVSALRDQYVAAYTLLSAVGKLTAAHLGLKLDENGGDYYSSVKNRNFGYDASDDTVWTLSHRP